MRAAVVLAGFLALGACTSEPGSESWCAEKKAQSKSEWSASDLATYTKNCLIDGTSVGSKDWCEGMSAKPKGEWTAEEATTYAKNCVL